MFQEEVRATGDVVVDFIDAVSGEVQNRLYLKNMVVQSGLDFLAAMHNGEGPAVMSHMAIGSNGTAAALGDTALVSETGRAALTSRTRSGNQVTYVADFPVGQATGTIAELGIFNAAGGGTMLARVAFTATAKESYASVRVTWVVTQS